METIIVFDVNETLLDVQTLSPYFEHMFGDKHALREWLSILLLHSEAATLAGPYFDFGTLAGAALDMIGANRSQRLAEAEKKRVLEAILHLPSHPEVKHALGVLRNAGLRMVTLTNSSQKTVEAQMHNAGLTEFFEKNFSVDAIKRYKPAPETYRMIADALGAENRQLRLVAAHGWDILGAMQAGWSGAFVARKGQSLFPLVAPPDVIGPDLLAVANQIVHREKG